MTFLAIVGLFLLLVTAFAQARDLDGKWAQAEPGLRQWFRDQHVPSGPTAGMSCCSDADGVYAETNWHDGSNWAQFAITIRISGKPDVMKDIPWMRVPEGAILKGPFPKDLWQSIVWWSAEWDDSRKGTIKRGPDGNLLVFIRCIKLGGGF